ASATPAVVAVVDEAPVPAGRPLAVIGDDVVQVVSARPVLPRRRPGVRNRPGREIDPPNGHASPKVERSDAKVKTPEASTANDSGPGRTRSSPSRVRFRPLDRRTFRFRVPPTG